uniref:Uncharacterized protein n=1 Tax=Oryza sativa subsp. japonica TaxID=39947 RepID=Q10R15_ORYSJ|nr:hypothetical protein LOC_Os03g07870 [Oryza sativa Japonica Group]
MAAWRASLAVADGQKQLTREARTYNVNTCRLFFDEKYGAINITTLLLQKNKKPNFQLLMALAFSAAPLTLYVPPVRSLSLFVEAIEAVFRDCAPYSQGAIFRFRLGLSRILSGLARALR